MYLHLPSPGDKGQRFWLNLQATTKDLYSDTSFVRLLSGFKVLYPTIKNHSVIARAEFGVLINQHFDEVPSSKRFFTGGDQTVRGFGFETLAPRNEDGEVIGGDRLNLVSLESQWRVSSAYALALFVDSGRAYFDSAEPFRSGAGIGLRWFSPVGQIRFDLATPINDSYYSGFQFHISMGPPI
jgi:translocation and assembly module TamA